jgi:DNA-3-methyladenine glycosylase I
MKLVIRGESRLNRCPWGNSDALLLRYHDTEWGVPVRNETKLFEFLSLEGMQAGLNWLIILKKRRNLRKAFEGFKPRRVARFSSRDVKRLLADPGIIRNRLKVTCVINNADRYLEVQQEFGSFSNYVWAFTEGRTIKHKFRSLSTIPAKTRESDAMSKDLKKRGFRFVGSTISYAFMQAVGMVNDHITSCFRYKDL